MCGHQEAHNGLGWETGEQGKVFYADYGRIEGRNPIWVQKTLKTLVRMFEQVGLCKNLGKTKSKTFTPGFIWG